MSSEPRPSLPAGTAQPPAKGSLAVEVTARCNRACAHCYNVWKAEPGPAPQELSGPELLELVFDTLAASCLERVQVTGGEPLLRKDLLFLLRALRDRGVQVSLVTGGSGIHEGLANEMARLKVGPVQPTLLAGEPELHDELAGRECFHATVDAIGCLRRAGVPVSVAFVCTRRNHGRFLEVLELCFALGVRTVAFSRFCASGAGTAIWQELMPDRQMIRACLDHAQWANARLGMNVRVAIALPRCCTDLRRYPNLRFGRCALSSPSPGFTMDPSGRLRACSISPTVLGDLRKEPWAELLARAREGYFEELTRLPEACRGCPLAQRCGGGCRETARSCWGGRPGQLDPLANPSAWLGEPDGN